MFDFDFQRINNENFIFVIKYFYKILIMITKKEAQQVIAMLKENFDSHDFILAYACGFTLSYLEMLWENKGDVRTADGKIGKFLSKFQNDLDIVNPKPKEIKSINIKGYVSDCTKWCKLKK